MIQENKNWETSKEQYEEMAREELFKLRTLIPVFEKSVLKGGEKKWGLESWQKIKEEFLRYVEKTGKTLEELGTTDEELQILESRVEALGLVESARRTRDMGPNRITKHETEMIINKALGAIGSSLEEVEDFQKKPRKKSK